jgi:mono/diheme cytochrome c family protein
MRKTIILTIVFSVSTSISWSNLIEDGSPRLGKLNYEYYCSSCHGKTGKGDGYNAKYLGKAPRDLSDGEYMSSRTNEKLYEIISEGGLRAGLSNLMPPWGKTLKSWEIRDLVAYIRTLHPKVEIQIPEEKEEEEQPEEEGEEEEELF